MAKMGVKLSEEHKQKLREAKLGNKNHRYGKRVSEETKKKMSISQKGKHNFWKGKKFKDEHKRKISQKQKGHRSYSTPEGIEKIRISKTGKKQSLESRLRRRGANCHFWRGGKSYEIYPVDWRNSLKISIRERDHYRCQICGENQGDETLAVHHIDYNKQNCNPNNLISLCRSCHAKTNINRDKWIEWFKNLLIII
jgi:hypothetical protein